MLGKHKITLTRYQYDALDRLTSSKPSDSTERQRYYCEERLVTEVRGTETVSIVNGGGQLLAEHQRSSEKIKIGLLASDLSRTVLAAHKMCRIPIAYSPYGHRPLESGLVSLLAFNGEQPDPVTGHYLLGSGYRAFNPSLMRFNSPDSLSPFEKGGVNSYAYCTGDPVNRSDPTGRSFLYRWLSLIPEFAGQGVLAPQISGYTKIADGLIAFTSASSKGRKLIIWGHGAPGIISTANGELLDAAQLKKLLEKNGAFARDFDMVQIASCSSADAVGQSESLAQSFSRIFGRPVKGYHGVIGNVGDTTKFVSDEMPETISFAIRKDRSALNRANMKRFNYQYKPETFYPESKAPSKPAANIRRG